MVLSQTAAQVMMLAQHGDADAAMEVAQRSYAAAVLAPPAQQASLWYAVATTEHIRGNVTGQVVAADRCLTLAKQARSHGWTANALTVRALARVREGEVEKALLDLARAEVELGECQDDADDGLAGWAATGLGYCYLELRLYELAEPRLEQAARAEGDPIPLADARLIDAMNLAELHLRWADELERARPEEDSELQVEQHRACGHEYAEQAVAEAERLESTSMLASARAVELCSRPRGSAEAAIPELRAAYESPDHADHQGGRAVVGCALARALWRTGRREEALATIREATRHSSAAGDWQVEASARWLLVEMESETGIPGARDGRDYARMLSRVMWQQRLSTLHGARTALEVERMHHDILTAQRAAREDPLTGVGNRRALDDALQEALLAEAGGSSAAGSPTTLLLIDLDDFKAVNDTHGHVLGDEVLRAVAAKVRTTARTADVVARLGGDEFVVLARGTDREAGKGLAARVRAAIDEIAIDASGDVVRLRASVGVATTGPEVPVSGLLDAADRTMYAAKHGRHRERERTG
ncbi:MAG TPA: diguanylate cyclase [Nocardioidaceae bacterium]|nr:diguanylate cyclase [Nocardioidaceae bacterium]